MEEQIHLKVVGSEEPEDYVLDMGTVFLFFHL